MKQLLLTVVFVFIVMAMTVNGQSLQSALDGQGYSINVSADEISGEVFFQRESANARIVFQESSQYLIEAMGWYTTNSDGEWLIGGTETGLPTEAVLPAISEQFGLKMHPNFTGTGFIQGIWYSEPSLNIDNSDHARVFHTSVNGQTVPYSYIVAWEDLSLDGGGDFQDMIVRIDGVQAVDDGAIPVEPPLPNTSMQAALNTLGYTINTAIHEIPGDLYFQTIQSNAAIVYQESSQHAYEAFGWYDEDSEGDWIIGGANTGFPSAAFLPNLSSDFGFKLHPNYTGQGFLTGPYYTEPERNPNGEDRARVFQTVIDGEVVPYSYLICWEDWIDDDYQDMIVRVDWVQPTCGMAASGAIAGLVHLDGAPVSNTQLELLDDLGIPTAETMTDENGDYLFEEVPNGTYSVIVTPPLGFSVDQDVQSVTVQGNDATADFELLAGAVNKPRHVWWWKIYLDDVRHDGNRRDYFTRSDVDDWGEDIYAHFYDRIDGLGIAMPGVTFTDGPVRALTFDDVCYFLLDADHSSYEASVERNMLANMLNVASGRMSQLAEVAEDGATLSQAITHFADVYARNAGWSENEFDKRDKLIRAYRALRDIAMGHILPAGSIPLETPNTLYRQQADGNTMPGDFVLAQNYPNPFNPTTEICFSTTCAGDVTLDVFNTVGQQVATLVDERKEAGPHSIKWDATRFASGVYFYRLQAGEFTDTRKMVLLK